MKRIIVLLALFGIVASAVLTGCNGSDNSTPPAPGTNSMVHTNK